MTLYPLHYANLELYGEGTVFVRLRSWRDGHIHTRRNRHLVWPGSQTTGIGKDRRQDNLATFELKRG